MTSTPLPPPPAPPVAPIRIGAVSIATPVVLIYQGWTYWVFRQRIRVEQIPPSVGLPLRGKG